nr:ribonuclease H-like domain-containing protein [Tanacetum cinerariifolium]
MYHTAYYIRSAGLKEANNSAGTQANDDQAANLEEINLHEEHFVLPIWSAYSTTVKSSGDKTQKTTNFKTCEKPISQVEQIFLEKLEKLKRQEKEANVVANKETTHENQHANTNSTNLLNAVSTPISTAGPSRAFHDGEPLYPDDLSMPHLKDIYASPRERIFTNSSYDDEGVVTDLNNLETTVNVSLTPTTRIHTIHPKIKIFKDPLSAVQTRSKVNKNSKAHALVWILVDLPFGKKATGTKWVYRNKKDKQGVIVRNKARLVAQGHRQEEGIDYDEIDFLSVKTASTPIETQKPLVKDEEAADVDVHLYRKSTTGEAEYVVVAHCCGQVLLTQNQLLDYGFNIINTKIYIDNESTIYIVKNLVNDVVKLRARIDGNRVTVTEDVIRQVLCFDDANGVECLPNEEIFTKLARKGYEEPPPKLTMNSIVQWRLLSSALQRVENSTFLSTFLTAWVGKSFSGVKTPLFATMLVQPQAKEEEDNVEVPAAPTLPSPTTEPSPPLQEPIPSPPQAQPAPPLSPPQDQQADTSESSMTQTFKLKRRVKKLEKKRRSKYSGLKRGRIEPIDADEEITLVDMETQVDLGAELQGRKDDDNAAIKDVSDAEPTVFDDEEITMTMAQTLIKIKAKKARLLDEQIAKRLHDEEIEQVAAREKQERMIWRKLKCYKSTQARKNMIVYLKNMHGYKMKHFKGMTYDKVRPIFEREYNKVQTLFKPDKNVEEPQKKRVVEETLLHESFKKLKAVKVLGSHSTQDTPTDDPKEISKEDVKNMLEIIPVSKFKVEALQVKYPLIDYKIHSERLRSYWKIIRVGGITYAYQSFEDMLKDFDREDLDVLWRLVKETFSSAVPIVDKEKALWVELKRLFEPDADDVIWKL